MKRLISIRGALEIWVGEDAVFMKDRPHGISFGALMS